MGFPGNTEGEVVRVVYSEHPQKGREGERDAAMVRKGTKEGRGGAGLTGGGGLERGAAGLTEGEPGGAEGELGWDACAKEQNYPERRCWERPGE